LVNSWGDVFLGRCQDVLRDLDVFQRYLFPIDGALLGLLDLRGSLFVLLDCLLDYPAARRDNDGNCSRRKDFRGLLDLVEERWLPVRSLRHVSPHVGSRSCKSHSQQLQNYAVA
jgi:hypothetical protein